MSFRLRAATTADAPGVHRIYAPFARTSEISFELADPGVEEMARRIADFGGRYPWLVAVEGAPGAEAVLGYAYGTTWRTRAAYRFTVETAIYVDPAHQRRGLARSLYGLLFELLARQGFRRAVAGITLPHPASVALHESFGFEPAGVVKACGLKNGRWWDVGFWQRELLPTDVPDPPEPRPVSAVLAEAAADGTFERHAAAPS